MPDAQKYYLNISSSLFNRSLFKKYRCKTDMKPFKCMILKTFPDSPLNDESSRIVLLNIEHKRMYLSIYIHCAIDI